MQNTLTREKKSLIVTVHTLTGSCRGQSLSVLGSRFLIGSDPRCNLRLTHPEASPLHCSLIMDGYTVRVRDLGSSVGTKVNGAPVHRDVILKNNDVISASHTLIKVNIETID